MRDVSSPAERQAASEGAGIGRARLVFVVHAADSSGARCGDIDNRTESSPRAEEGRNGVQNGTGYMMSTARSVGGMETSVRS